MTRKTAPPSVPVPEPAAPPTCERLWTVQDVSAFLGVFAHWQWATGFVWIR